MQRQVYTQPGATPEEVQLRNPAPAITSGHIWAGAEQIGWIKDGEVFSVATQKKIGTVDEANNLISTDGQPLNLHLELVNGGGRIGAESSTTAIATFKSVGK